MSFSELPAAAVADLCRITGCTTGIPAADGYLRMLADAGFSAARLEPKTVYTREVLEEKARRKGRMDSFARIADADIDAKTGSVVVYAWKQGL